MECTRFWLQGDYIMKKKVRVVSLACDMPTGPPLNLYQILSYYLKQYGSYGLHKISLWGRQLYKEESESCLSCMGHAYWCSSSSLLNIIKLSQTVWELWLAQDFGFRGDNYIMKIVRVVTLACNIPTGLLLHFYQTLSKYALGYQSYGLHKTSVSGEITTQQIRKELSLLHATCLLVLLFIPTKYYQIISNSMGVTACTNFRLQGR